MSYAAKLAVIVLVCQACAVCGIQLRAQESTIESTRQDFAAADAATPLMQNAPETGAGETRVLQSHQPSNSIFEARNFSTAGQRDQPSAEGFGTARFAEAHRFWDRENMWLFAGVGAARALDYTSTLNMRRRGRQEILLDNSVVDNHPLFAGIEAIGAEASIGVSYWLHRTDHHRLERWVSIVHIGLASSGAARNYALKTFHTVPPR